MTRIGASKSSGPAQPTVHARSRIFTCHHTLQVSSFTFFSLTHSLSFSLQVHIIVSSNISNAIDNKNNMDEKRPTKVPTPHRDPDTLRYIEKKLCDEGVARMERHPVDGLGLSKPPPKSGHGGKFTWEGPTPTVEAELEPVPPAIDEKDPNYVGDEEGEMEEEGVVIGEVGVAEAKKEGVSRVEVVVPPRRQTN
ncbi:hypothetical protein QJS10_CPB13g01702 [Acorus calamus]|uniref:Uncharacterized protein n=1 Tax=Acorus calamus TaxID=4465 RepID=A0AAV9DFG2_ACOCL|nr:hypothetical protein QJS10_CPB13g01702 [Acorus calamus]